MREFKHSAQAGNSADPMGSSEIIQAIAMASLDAMITIDGAGKVLEFSPSAETLFGYTRSETLGRSVSEIVIPPRLRDAHESGMRHYNATGEGPVINTRVEVPAHRKDGTEFDAELTVVPLKVDGRQYFTAFVRDISEQKAAQQAVEEARERAERASAAKSRFLSTMSHELRTPMNVILGALDILNYDGIPPSQKELTAAARESGRALLTMIDEIIEFSAMDGEAPVMQCNPTDIVALIRAASKPWERQAAAKGISLKHRIDGPIPPLVLVDAAKLESALNQLIDNAVKFSEQGEIELALLCTSDDNGAEVKISVSDQGVGMSEETCEHLFEPFYQGDTSATTGYSGTGIGLAIAARLVDAMGGSLKVVSEANRGSRFYFSLRLDLPKDAAPTVGKSAKTGHVLIVDDGPANRMIVEAMLVRAGYSTDQAANGEEAVAKAAATHYDLILMDMRMPKLDGLDATRAIRALPGEVNATAIIALTANVSSEDRNKCMDAGMNGFLSKPIELSSLLDCIQQWCAVRVDNRQDDD